MVRGQAVQCKPRCRLAAAGRERDRSASQPARWTRIRLCLGSAVSWVAVAQASVIRECAESAPARRAHARYRCVDCDKSIHRRRCSAHLAGAWSAQPAALEQLLRARKTAPREAYKKRSPARLAARAMAAAEEALPTDLRGVVTQPWPGGAALGLEAPKGIEQPPRLCRRTAARFTIADADDVAANDFALSDQLLDVFDADVPSLPFIEAVFGEQLDLPLDDSKTKPSKTKANL